MKNKVLITFAKEEYLAELCDLIKADEKSKSLKINCYEIDDFKLPIEGTYIHNFVITLNKIQCCCLVAVPYEYMAKLVPIWDGNFIWLLRDPKDSSEYDLFNDYKAVQNKVCEKSKKKHLICNLNNKDIEEVIRDIFLVFKLIENF